MGLTIKDRQLLRKAWGQVCISELVPEGVPLKDACAHIEQARMVADISWPDTLKMFERTFA